MNRDFAREIDELKKEFESFKNFIQAMNPPKSEHVGHVEKISNMHPDPAVNELMSRLQDRCGQEGRAGCITYMGVLASGGRQANWIRNEVGVDELLAQTENGAVEKVLACIGNPDRMRLLVSLLRKPQTVAELVEGGYSSTGQVYNLLKPLITADLVQENPSSGHRGQYIVVPHRVQGIVMLLAGISDMMDPAYTQGHWA